MGSEEFQRTLIIVGTLALAPLLGKELLEKIRSLITTSAQPGGIAL